MCLCQVELLKNRLGFDDAFNYKEEKDLDGALKRYKLIFSLLGILYLGSLIKL